MNLVRDIIELPTNQIDVRIGMNIRRIRERAGMSQSELARKLGTTQSRMSDLELGKRRLSISALVEIGALLEADVVEFFLKP